MSGGAPTANCGPLKEEVEGSRGAKRQGSTKDHVPMSM
jgi:hypothetical protein